MPRQPRIMTDDEIAWVRKHLYIEPSTGRVLKYYPKTQEVKEMGFKNEEGYHIITVNRRPVPRAQLIWWEVTGIQPLSSLRRRNGDHGDDRIENLYLWGD